MSPTDKRSDPLWEFANREFRCKVLGTGSPDSPMNRAPLTPLLIDMCLTDQ
jgi:hypothetical protein